MEDGLASVWLMYWTMTLTSLNPYCSGRWSRTVQDYKRSLWEKVLILIVMEDGLIQTFKTLKIMKISVLILVVVDDGLVLLDITIKI